MDHAHPRRRALLAAAAATACAAALVYPISRTSAHAATPALTVLTKAGTGPRAGEAEPWFKVVNNGSTAVDLSQVTLHYYFTADGGDYRYACAWAHLGCANLTGTVDALTTPSSTADHELTLTLGGGTLAPGADTGVIQTRLYRADWQSVDQSDDYSYVDQTSYADNAKVTADLDGSLVWGTPPAGTPTSPPPTSSPPTSDGALFDDFAYTGNTDPKLTADGWSIRTGSGGPGIAGTWSKDAVSFPTDSTAGDDHVMELTATTDGTTSGTTQAEVDTTARKFFQGTYAARVYFNDTPSSGTGADDVNETFYTITPDNSLYSELDNEYLPNGGWGAPGPTLYTTTWYSADAMDRQTHNVINSLQGWHTLEMTVADGTVTYYVDGKEYFSTTGKYYPREAMTLDFNEWFISGGLASATDTRQWKEKVDWVYYDDGPALTPSQVNSNVADLRAAGTTFTDTVPSS